MTRHCSSTKSKEKNDRTTSGFANFPGALLFQWIPSSKMIWHCYLIFPSWSRRCTSLPCGAGVLTRGWPRSAFAFFLSFFLFMFDCQTNIGTRINCNNIYLWCFTESFFFWRPSPRKNGRLRPYACSTLQHTATHCDTPKQSLSVTRDPPVFCGVLQCAAVCCSVFVLLMPVTQSLALECLHFVLLMLSVVLLTYLQTHPLPPTHIRNRTRTKTYRFPSFYFAGLPTILARLNFYLPISSFKLDVMSTVTVHMLSTWKNSRRIAVSWCDSWPQRVLLCAAVWRSVQTLGAS